jgi:hypothetical protein
MCLPRARFWPWSSHLPFQHSWDYRCRPLCLAYWLRWGLANFLARLASNHDLPHHFLPSSWNYRYAHHACPITRIYFTFGWCPIAIPAQICGSPNSSPVVWQTYTQLLTDCTKEPIFQNKEHTQTMVKNPLCALLCFKWIVENKSWPSYSCVGAKTIGPFCIKWLLWVWPLRTCLNATRSQGLWEKGLG